MGDITDTTDYGIPEDVMYNDALIGTTAAGFRGDNSGILMYGNEIELENGVIPTDLFLNASSDSYLYSYGGQAPNFDTQALFNMGEQLEALYSLTKAGQRSQTISEGIAGGGIGDVDTSAETPEDGVRRSYFSDLGLDIISPYSVGLGFLEIKTEYSTGDGHGHKGIAYFTYGPDSIGAPEINLTADDWEWWTVDGTTGTDARRNRFESDDAWQAANDEQIGLNLKFGHDITWSGDTGLETGLENSPMYSGLSSSMMTIVENIITTFPENILTFARTRPLRLKHSDIYEIETDEELEDSSFASSMTTITNGSY
jgi:hypothetical protein